MGIATAPEIIAARKTAAEAGYNLFKAVHLASAVRGALGLGVDAGAKPLFDAMHQADPTLDLEPSDLEAVALLAAVLSAEMKERSRLGGLTALALVTAAFGAVRQSPTHPQLIREAEETLANMQISVASRPTDSAAPEMPSDVTGSLDEVTIQNTPYGQIVAPAPTKAAIRKVADYALAVQAAAIASVNNANAYTRRLEEELRTYWWVVGGWSDELNKPFRLMKQSEAAILAGYELAAKTTLPLGLFAALALLDRVIREDRKGRPQKLALSDSIAEAPAVLQTRFQAATALNGDLLPVSLALQLSGEVGEDEDWRPRFKRITRISADSKMGPHDLALQLYREVVIARVLPRAK
ncbi:GTPase-associated system all-helical protein GASH [Sphingomonas sp.]|uniref:GTPase-associated system all-helical protein GASH n=1 Tax=Sphingomonas sp. TaxID=28214 RepID=UPI0028A8F290|nr:GTPase-associated system all-helical protein GASH [Sphingomonas sp.]